MPLLVDIILQGDHWVETEGLAVRIEAALGAASEEASTPLGDDAEVSVVLADDAAVQVLNRTWRGIDAPTNVLAFPAAALRTGATPTLLGDVVVAFETASREARREGKDLGDHVIHLVVHGFLHLLGHDHHEDQEAATMERLERRILARFGISDPYADVLIADEVRP